jgi:hypothetical protein
LGAKAVHKPTVATFQVRTGAAWDIALVASTAAAISDFVRFFMVTPERLIDEERHFAQQTRF